jgi:glycerol-3-phosphate dehydrogenase
VIRDLSSLAGREFDLLVVGGGIYGLAISYDAAQRGLAVALVERSDFGAATSFNHLRTIHGGLRYLQSADLRRMRESIRERRAFARVAPRFVAPLPFLMPTSSSLARNAFSMRLALALDALVGLDRNNDIAPSRRLPPGRLASAHECREFFSGAVSAVTSGALWYDYETVGGDRLTLAFAIAAAERGTALANYIEAGGLLRDRTQRVCGITATDRFSDRSIEIRGRVIVNAAGPWAATFLRQAGLTTRWPLIKAMNLVTSRPARRAALVAPTREGRGLVLLPWQGRTLVGTSESTDERSPDDQQARREEVTAFVDQVNQTFPDLHLKPEEITLVHRGIVPAMHRGGQLRPLGHSRIVDHASDGVKELISVIGAKYTTARATAERTVDLVLRKLGRGGVPCRTMDAVLPGAGLDDKDPADPVARAIRSEMAHTLIDVVVRRTGVGATAYPGDAVAIDYANRMQKELGWSQEQRERELRELPRFYEIV